MQRASSCAYRCAGARACEWAAEDRQEIGRESAREAKGCVRARSPPARTHARGAALREAAALRQLLVELAARRKLEDDVDALLVVKVAVHAQDVLVPQVALDLNLAPQLVLHARLAQLALHQDLERHDELRVGLDAGEVDIACVSGVGRGGRGSQCGAAQSGAASRLRQRDARRRPRSLLAGSLTKLAAAERPADVKIVERPAAPSGGSAVVRRDGNGKGDGGEEAGWMQGSSLYARVARAPRDPAAPRQRVARLPRRLGNVGGPSARRRCRDSRRYCRCNRHRGRGLGGRRRAAATCRRRVHIVRRRLARRAQRRLDLA